MRCVTGATVLWWSGCSSIGPAAAKRAVAAGVGTVRKVRGLPQRRRAFPSAGLDKLFDCQRCRRGRQACPCNARDDVITCYHIDTRGTLVMKSHRTVTQRQEAQAERKLVEALLTMRTSEECRSFLRVLERGTKFCLSDRRHDA